MKSFLRLSLAEQTAVHLRAKLHAGHWGGKLPGVIRLCTELNVSQATMRAAIRRLEAEGLLAAGGQGRSRTVAAAGTAGAGRRALRVGVLLHEQLADENPGMQDALARLQHDLEQAGHVCFFSTQCQSGLHYDTGRIASHLAGMDAQAWVVVAPRLELLEWLAAQPVPAISTGARSREIALAGATVDRQPSMVAATRTLLALGHQRIVLICPRGLREPVPAPIVRAFTAELTAAGRRWSPHYNVPEWEETPEGFRALLAGLFGGSPPTALLLDETPRVVATLAFCAERGWRVPEQVSLVAMQADSSLAWCHPPLARIHWELAPINRRVVRWLAAVEKGDPDREHITFPAEFVPGGSIGPVWKE